MGDPGRARPAPRLAAVLARLARPHPPYLQPAAPLPPAHQPPARPPPADRQAGGALVPALQHRRPPRLHRLPLGVEAELGGAAVRLGNRKEAGGSG